MGVLCKKTENVKKKVIDFLKFEFSTLNHSLRYCYYLNFYKKLSFE